MRANSFTPRAITWNEHVAWYERRLASPASRLYVVSDEAEAPIGVVRFEAVADGAMEVGISLDEAHRGRGLSREALGEACRALRGERPGARIVARVRLDNAASLAAFRSAGFARQGTESVKGHQAARFELPAEAV